MQSQSTATVSGSPGSQPAGGLGRAAAVAVGLTVLAFLASLLAVLGTFRLLGAVGVDSQSTIGFLALLVTGQLAFLAVGLWYVHDRIAVPIRVPTLSELKYVLLGVVVAFAIAIGLSVVRMAFFPATDSVLADVFERSPETLLYLAGLSIVLIAPAEELLFRGAIQGRLRRATGPVAAILGASATFGIMHLFNFTGALGGALAAAAVVGIASLVWGYVYERTDNLAVPILGHGLYNATLMGLAYVAVLFGA